MFYCLILSPWWNYHPICPKKEEAGRNHSDNSPSQRVDCPLLYGCALTVMGTYSYQYGEDLKQWWSLSFTVHHLSVCGPGGMTQEGRYRHSCTFLSPPTRYYSHIFTINISLSSCCPSCSVAFIIRMQNKRQLPLFYVDLWYRLSGFFLFPSPLIFCIDL